MSWLLFVFLFIGVGGHVAVSRRRWNVTIPGSNRLALRHRLLAAVADVLRPLPLLEWRPAPLSWQCLQGLAAAEVMSVIE
ncbi:hypothetical protein BU24DRAFT_417751 [Aaosphaeria arxii CBS 175.79]|uniref:Secreted protein n=1 Tax=Aaosphaeria arxii CBS 175.79 TaxID=1450172 RepID=A0A6A5YAP6_9PLEO|nr:uncharacterized protein BU24DRAFT_417751 [Aaosphaeria arxii CBS 175.79]KAF2022097.1 hypothetical protein BU24DRAFT_417751 [Aaosphaeria arxii CBS 175.79]